MKQSFTWIGVVTVLGFAASLMGAERPGGAAREAGDSWVLLAGCPEACGPSRALGSGGALQDPNAAIMQLNLDQDGLADTREAAPSQDPGPGADLVWALNRLNDGLDGGAEENRPPSAAFATTASPIQENGRAGGSLPEFVATTLPAAEHAVSWAQRRYEAVAARLEERWTSATRALGLALVRSWVAVTAASPEALEESDPEMQPTLDPLTAAWIASVRRSRSADAATATVDGVVLTANTRAANDLPRNVSAPSARTAIDRDETGFSEAPHAASQGSEAARVPSLSSFDVTSSADVEIGCGAIGLPRPIDAPRRARTISY